MKNDVHIVSLHALPFLPYVYGLLRSSVEDDDELAGEYHFAEPFFLLEPLTAIVARMESPAVVGLSCYVWNHQRQMKLARLVKERFPESLIVAGGPHVPNRVGDFFRHHPQVDLLVHNDGEVPFREILRQRLRARRDYASIRGVTWQRDGEPIAAAGPAPVLIGKRPPSRRLTGRSPYASGYIDEAIARCHARGLRFYGLWETNRGCPYECSFCDWGSSALSVVRAFDLDRLFEDIEVFGRQRIPNLFICDANFGMLPRDLEIAERIAETRRRTGFPQQVRVNFAKNSNDRVFEISRIFAEAGVLMGTTLSMQSTSEEVLDAIDRRNIGVRNFARLKKRYESARIHTYTELILGLPRETARSFKRGIGELLAAGNHEDLRVFEFMVLPNAPINTPETIARFGLTMIDKHLYLTAGDAPDDEVERAPIVIETSDLSREDWVDCSVFAQMIQVLHNGCYTRYVAMWAHRAHEWNFDVFYDRLIEHFAARPQTVLGRIIDDLTSLFRHYQTDPRIPLANLIASQPALLARVASYGRRRGWTADQWAWLCISSEHERFYRELHEFLGGSISDDTGEMEELLRYQSDRMLQLDYDPAAAKICRYEWDFPAWAEGADLERRAVVVRYADTHMGVNRAYPLLPRDRISFAKAALGESYPFVRIRHYQHQMDCAELWRDGALQRAQAVQR